MLCKTAEIQEILVDLSSILWLIKPENSNLLLKMIKTKHGGSQGVRSQKDKTQLSVFNETMELNQTQGDMMCLSKPSVCETAQIQEIVVVLSSSLWLIKPDISVPFCGSTVLIKTKKQVVLSLKSHEPRNCGQSSSNSQFQRKTNKVHCWC